MAKTKKAAQPAREDPKAAQKTATPAADETTAGGAATAPAKAKKGEEKVWDSSKGYTGTQSDYRPPDTDPARQAINEGEGNDEE